MFLTFKISEFECFGFGMNYGKNFVEILEIGTKTLFFPESSVTKKQEKAATNRIHIGSSSQLGEYNKDEMWLGGQCASKERLIFT
jgi:hypothetical protein